MILWIALIVNLLSNFSRGDSSEAACAAYFFLRPALLCVRCVKQRFPTQPNNIQNSLTFWQEIPGWRGFRVPQVIV